MELLIIFIFGLSIGSFLNVVIFRLGKKEGIISGRSQCKECGKNLKWNDLIPLFSFFALRGKCRYCRKNISLIYPLTELGTAIAFVVYFYVRGSYEISNIYDIVLISSFICLALFDLLFFWLPDKIILPLTVIALIYGAKLLNFEHHLITGLVIGSLFAIIHLASKGKWMGLGDAKLVFLIGIIFGFPVGALAILTSVWLAAITGIILLIAGKANLKTPLPLGTFLAVTSIIFIIFQNEIQNITQAYFQ